MPARALRVPFSPLRAGLCQLPEAEAAYVVRVHRYQPGDILLLVDTHSHQEALARVSSIQAHTVFVDVDTPYPSFALAQRDITLVQAIGKADKLDTVVRAATELGATRIVPLQTRRTVVRMDPARSIIRVDRWRRIALQAARQCGRGDVPEITPVLTLEEAITTLRAEVRVLLLPQASQGLGAVLLSAGEAVRSIAFLVGPEGGFDAREQETAQAHGWCAASLGPFALRTETVAAAVLGALLVLLDALQGSPCALVDPYPF